MSQHKAGAAVGATPLADPFSEDSVADYLHSHPDFFDRHPLTLAGLELPHRAGSAVSLVERQIAMLRERNAQLERQFKDLVGVAKQNDVLVEKLHQLGVRLLGAPDASTRLERLETTLREDFKADRAVLVMFEGQAVAAVRDGFVKRIPADDALVRPFAAFLRAGRPRCGALRDRQKDVFDRDGDAILSAAFMPLGKDASLGFLVVGSRDQDHFHPGQRIDFLARLGELLSVALGGEPPHRAGA
jgi:uncharacterized protein YigA (DUF484 family)